MLYDHVRTPANGSQRRHSKNADAEWLRSQESGVLALQQSAGNRAVGSLLGGGTRPARLTVQRKIAADKDVDEYQKLLGITGTVRGIEVPKVKTVTTVTPFGNYPESLNLTDPMKKMSLAELHYATPADQLKKSDPDLANEPADTTLDMMGGGAYNSQHDLVVLAAGYPAPALLHEMGHKAQNEGGASNDTAVTVVLEYHNVLKNQNRPWLDGVQKAPAPRTFYNKDLLKPTTKTWEQFKSSAYAKFHHQEPETKRLIEEIETMTSSGRYDSEKDSSGNAIGEVAKKNLVAEYFSLNP
jgi:hypothetical protein